MGLTPEMIAASEAAERWCVGIQEMADAVGRGNTAAALGYAGVLRDGFNAHGGALADLLPLAAGVAPTLIRRHGMGGDVQVYPSAHEAVYTAILFGLNLPAPAGDRGVWEQGRVLAGFVAEYLRTGPEMRPLLCQERARLLAQAPPPRPWAGWAASLQRKLLDCLADAGRPVPLGEVYAAVYGTPLPVKKADRRAAINKLHRVRADAEAHLASAGRPERIETDPVTEGWALVPPFPDC